MIVGLTMHALHIGSEEVVCIVYMSLSEPALLQSTMLAATGKLAWLRSCGTQ